MILVVSASLVILAHASVARPRLGKALAVLPQFPDSRVLPSTANCTLRWFNQTLDHFSYSAEIGTDSFQQRYFICGKYGETTAPPAKAVFFYCGNEANVELYVNATGLMWENYEEFGALLVFAEHRHYGKSIPRKLPSETRHPYLTHELALADYATLIAKLKLEGIGGVSEHTPVVAFGGSYGGKLAAWMRMKYPGTVVGAISASAPLLAFQGLHPTWDSQSYYRVVTNTAKHYSSTCASNIRASFGLLAKAERNQLAEWFMLCQVPASDYEVSMLRYFLRDAFDGLAMGNYPFPSSYIGGSQAQPMPAWPFKQACSYLKEPSLATDPAKLFPALREAVAILYNATGEARCFHLPRYPTSFDPQEPMDGIWDWQYCTENMPDSYWFSTDGQRDMFWYNPYNQTLIDEHCKMNWGLAPRVNWVGNEYGGRSLLQGHSNIVFSSGAFDGWSSGGVATNISASSLYSILIPDGAHHLDLMFSHPEDPDSVARARKFELLQIQRWIQGHQRAAYAKSWGDEEGKHVASGMSEEVIEL